MPTLGRKSRGGAAWIPNQVAYGLDCSDPDPSKWVPFGSQVDAAAAAARSDQGKKVPVADPLLRPVRVEP